MLTDTLLRSTPFMPKAHPALVVLSSLFPSAEEPIAGVFIRERMFRVAMHLPVTVIAPQPWFPMLSLVRRWRPGYRPERAVFELMDGIEVYRPRFLALPGVGRRFDGLSLALACRSLVRRLQKEGRADILDVHFAYPDGYGGSLLARWLKLPYVVTLRGKEYRLKQATPLRRRMERAMRGAMKVIGVSSALRDLGIQLGARPEDAMHVGNGIDVEKFFPVPRDSAREQLGIPADAQVLVSIGALGERKGFHRIIECLPALLKSHPRLKLLIVGGPSPEGDWTQRLHQMVREMNLADQVRFLGVLRPDALRVPLSAADVFVLPTRYEGWANVLLEAMACGLPVVTTDVGGNAEVVCRTDLGIVVPFDARPQLTAAIEQALEREWDRAAIREYAQQNAWNRRIETLVAIFTAIHGPPTVALGEQEHR